MEPDVHQVLLWLYQENPWLYVIHTLQRVIIFGGRRVNSNFGERVHQIQLVNTPQITISFWITNLLSNYSLAPPPITFIKCSVNIQYFSFFPHCYFQFFLYLLLVQAICSLEFVYSHFVLNKQNAGCTHYLLFLIFKFLLKRF